MKIEKIIKSEMKENNGKKKKWKKKRDEKIEKDKKENYVLKIK